MCLQLAPVLSSPVKGRILRPLDWLGFAVELPQLQYGLPDLSFIAPNQNLKELFWTNSSAEWEAITE